MQFEKNNKITEWELNTPKEIRASAVKDACNAFKSGMSNLKAGNIKFFKLGFRKKNNMNKCIEIPKNYINQKNGIIQIAPTFFLNNSQFKMGKKSLKKHKNIEINNNVRLTK